MNMNSSAVSPFAAIDINAPVEESIECLLNIKFHNQHTKATYKRYLLRYCDFMEIKTLSEILDKDYQEVIDRCILFLNDHNPNTKKVMLSAIGVLFNYISKAI